MYTSNQYTRAKAQVDGAPPEAQAILRQRIAEYEQANPIGPPAPPKTGDVGGAAGGALGEVGSEQATPKFALPPDTAPPRAPAAEPPQHAQPVFADLGPAPPVDPDFDPDLPNASKLKTLAAPPEYVSQNPQAGLAHIAASRLDPRANSFFEPTEGEFLRVQGATLKARGIQPGTPEFSVALDEYRDRKWIQALQQAQAEDRPLTRIAYVGDHAQGWDKLKNTLVSGYDTGIGFAKGFLSGRSLHAVDAMNAVEDKLTGSNFVDENRDLAERNPTANLAGEIVGGASKGGPLAKVAKFANPTALSTSKSLLARTAGAAISGAAAGETDLAARSAAQGLGDLAHGRSLESAKDNFTSHLIGSGLLGAGFGAGGHLAAEAANSVQKWTGQSTPELAQLRRGGGDTDALTGIRPGQDVAENLETAREPLPGEAKAPSPGNPTEVAAGKVQEPLARANAEGFAATKRRIIAEQDAAHANSPALQRPTPVKNLANQAVDWVTRKLQPEAKEGYLPGMKVGGKAAPAAQTGAPAELTNRLWRSRIVTAAEAANEARATGGRVITVEQAQRLGIDVGALKSGLDVEGVPAGAPPISDPSAGSVVSPVKALPKYSKADLANAATTLEPTAEEAEAVRRFTFGKRAPGDPGQITGLLDRSPVSPLPHVYRGMGMHPEKAAEFLANDTFSVGDSPVSASSDPMVARSFAARNQVDPGDVGITLKLKHTSARDIGSLADGQVKVESELLLPPRSTFRVISRQKDAAVPGNWIVTAEEIPAEAPAGATTEQVFGRPADKPSPFRGGILGARPGRAAITPKPTPGSDWDPRDRPYTRAGADEATAVDNGPPIPPSAARATGRPSGPPTELTPTAAQQAKPSAAAQSASAAGLPPDHFKVILEPREYDAKQLEEIIADIDNAANAGAKSGAADPGWKDMQRAARLDRDQFGPDWQKMLARHHAELNAIEQRGAHAGLKDNKSYSEMSGDAQRGFNGKLVNFPGDTASNQALRELAKQAGPGVVKDLEVLGAQNAYSKLKGLATPKIGETLGSGGVVGHLRGLGPAVKFRADAFARQLSAGPTGEPTITPRLAAFLQENVPAPRRWLPGAPALGAGALGLKAGVAYNTLTPDQLAFLARVAELFAPSKQKETGANQ